MTRTHFKTAKLLPSATTEAAQLQPRTDLYGAVHVRGEPLAWVEEGSYFKALFNATPMTGVAQTIQTAYAATNALICMQSNSATKQIIPHYIRLTCTAAGASSTSSNFAIALDTASRYSSAGTDITSLITNPNTAVASSGSSINILRVGAVTLSAAGAGTRLVAQGVLKTQAAPCWTVGDEVLITFGDVAVGGSASPISGSAAIAITKNVGPVTFSGTNHGMHLHLWNPANATTAPSWAGEIAWWER